MTTAAKILCDLADIDFLFGTEAYFEFILFQLIHEYSNLYSFCHTKLAYNSFQIFRSHTVKIHHIFPNIGRDTGSI